MSKTEKECPFCGAEMVLDSDMDNDDKKYYICLGCGFEATFAWG